MITLTNAQRLLWWSLSHTFILSNVVVLFYVFERVLYHLLRWNNLHCLDHWTISVYANFFFWVFITSWQKLCQRYTATDLSSFPQILSEIVVIIPSRKNILEKKRKSYVTRKRWVEPPILLLSLKKIELSLCTKIFFSRRQLLVFCVNSTVFLFMWEYMNNSYIRLIFSVDLENIFSDHCCTVIFIM